MQIDFEEYKHRENISPDKNNNKQNTEDQMDEIITHKIRDSQKDDGGMAINKPEDNPQENNKNASSANMNNNPENNRNEINKDDLTKNMNDEIEKKQEDKIINTYEINTENSIGKNKSIYDTISYIFSNNMSIDYDISKIYFFIYNPHNFNSS